MKEKVDAAKAALKTVTEGKEGVEIGLNC